MRQSKQWSLWKAQRPDTLPWSPNVSQPLHFSQNDGPTGRSVINPGATSGGGKAVEGGGTSGGPDAVCVPPPARSPPAPPPGPAPPAPRPALLPIVFASWSSFAPFLPDAAPLLRRTGEERARRTLPAAFIPSFRACRATIGR